MTWGDRNIPTLQPLDPVAAQADLRAFLQVDGQVFTAAMVRALVQQRDGLLADLDNVKDELRKYMGRDPPVDRRLTVRRIWDRIDRAHRLDRILKTDWSKVTGLK